MHFCSAGDNIAFSIEECDRYLVEVKTLPYTSFDALISGTNSLRIVRFNKKIWMFSSCPCVCFLKNCLCYHVVGVAVRRKKFDLDISACQIPIGAKSKPVRQVKMSGQEMRAYKTRSTYNLCGQRLKNVEEDHKKLIWIITNTLFFDFFSFCFILL